MVGTQSSQWIAFQLLFKFWGQGWDVILAHGVGKPGRGDQAAPASVFGIVGITVKRIVIPVAPAEMARAVLSNHIVVVASGFGYLYANTLLHPAQRGVCDFANFGVLALLFAH